MYKSSVAGEPPIGEIITIGDELNRGEIVDTNAAWLAEQLTDLGYDVRYRQGVCDRPDDMQAALLQGAGRSQVVVVSGGLGPTEDDRTVDVAAQLCGTEPEQEPAHQQRMEQRFSERNFQLTPNNLRQVRIPGGAVALRNEAGMAPGFQIQLQAAQLFFMPGVPREMKPMFTGEIVPRLRLLRAGGTFAVRRTYRVIGLGESHVDHRLADLLAGLPEAARAGLAAPPTIHYRLAFPEVLVTIVAHGRDEEAARAVLKALDPEVRRRLAGALYSEGGDDLPVVIGRKLAARGETLATAESCTGGMIGQLVTAVAGSSSYYVGGVVSYANEVKAGVLGVSQETLALHGAVSAECVSEMAQGVRRVCGATYGVAVSGVAGPGGGTADKPVGTVHLAVAGPAGVVLRKLCWPGDREQVRRIAACAALNILDKVLTPERGSMPQERLG